MAIFVWAGCSQPGTLFLDVGGAMNFVLHSISRVFFALVSGSSPKEHRDWARQRWQSADPRY
jgi:hypothetical protein